MTIKALWLILIPLITEFLDRDEFSEVTDDSEKRKQDCEFTAFKRLAARLKNYFPRLNIAVTLVGLYTKGPIFEQCQNYGWDYMIVLKDGSLKTVWQDIEKLKQKDKVDKYSTSLINGVRQDFWWVNGIDYHYGDNGCKSIKVNVVRQHETLGEVIVLQ